MWKKESKWVNTKIEKTINSNLYFKDCRLLTTKEMHEYDRKNEEKNANIEYTRKMLGYNDIINTKESNPIMEEVMEAITSAPSLIL